MNPFSLRKSIKLCSTMECKDEAIVSTDFCAKHILSTEKEQFLIRQCCFRHLDGQQCRVPVNNILATIAVCNDHMNAVCTLICCYATLSGVFLFLLCTNNVACWFCSLKFPLEKNSKISCSKFEPQNSAKFQIIQNR